LGVRPGGKTRRNNRDWRQREKLSRRYPNQTLSVDAADEIIHEKQEYSVNAKYEYQSP
jgi:hypothetical protein